MSRKRLAYSHVCVNLSKIAVTLDILAGDDMIWSLSWILHHFSSRGQRRRHNRGWGIRKNRLDFLCSLKWEFCEKRTSLSLSYQISWLVCPCSRGCPELFSEGRCPWLTEPEKATQTHTEREIREFALKILQMFNVVICNFAGEVSLGAKKKEADSVFGADKPVDSLHLCIMFLGDVFVVDLQH